MPAASRAWWPASGVASVLRGHWLIAILLLAGLVLRVLALVAYRPALFYNDTTRYLLHADGNDPVGYRVPLRLILLAGNLQTVAAVQHLIGLAMAVALYALLLRRGARRWLAALGVAPVLLDAYQVQMEQTILPETWFEALIVVGLMLLLWRPAPPLWLIAIAGGVLGLSVTFRQAGEILILPAVVYVAMAARGLRRAVAGTAVVCVAFAVPIVGYMTISYAVTGHFWLSRYGTAALYGRAAAAADCATLRVPASQRAMCPTAAQKAALGRDGLEHSPRSPIRRYYAQLPPRAAAHAVSSFTRAVIAQQPLRVLSAVGGDAVKLFALTRDGSPGDPPISRWQFQDFYPTYRPHATRVQITAAIRQFGGGGPAVAVPVASFLRGYQLGGGYTPGPLYAIAALAGLAGSAGVAGRRRASRGRAVGDGGRGVPGARAGAWADARRGVDKHARGGAGKDARSGAGDSLGGAGKDARSGAGDSLGGAGKDARSGTGGSLGGAAEGARSAGEGASGGPAGGAEGAAGGDGASLPGSRGWPRGSQAGAKDRELALACLLFLLTGAALLLVSDVFEFSWRYQLPALITLPPAGALGLTAIAGRYLGPARRRLTSHPEAR